MDEQLKENLKSGSTWIRGLYMLLFIVLVGIARIVLNFVVLFQFGTKLFTGNTNDRLLELSQNIASYSYQVIRFLGFNTEEKPYPFGEWPKKAQDEKAASPKGNAIPKPKAKPKSKAKPKEKSEQDSASETGES